MLVYSNLIIPIITTIILFVFYKQKVVIWEYILLFGVALISIFISKYVVETSATNDTEYWGGFVTEARYYEAWDEEVPCTHSYDCFCSTDKDGNECCCQTCYYHAYDVDNHPEYWYVVDSNGKGWNVSKGHFDYLVDKFGITPAFKDLNRDYHSYDGDMYYVEWLRTLATLEPTNTKHKYENRVRVSSSIYALDEPDTAIFNMYGLFHYPKITGYYDQVALLGYNDPQGEKQLQIINALYGASSQFKTFVLVYKNQPRDAAHYQMQQWQGTNKNEFVVCIGINDSKEIQWAEVLTWSESYDMITNVKNSVQEMKTLDVSRVADIIVNEVKISGQWKRKEFAEFSYLTVEPSVTALMIVLFITSIICFGVAWYVVANEFEEYGNKRYRRH